MSAEAANQTWEVTLGSLLRPHCFSPGCQKEMIYGVFQLFLVISESGHVINIHISCCSRLSSVKWEAHLRLHLSHNIWQEESHFFSSPLKCKRNIKERVKLAQVRGQAKGRRDTRRAEERWMETCGEKQKPFIEALQMQETQVGWRV